MVTFLTVTYSSFFSPLYTTCAHRGHVRRWAGGFEALSALPGDNKRARGILGTFVMTGQCRSPLPTGVRRCRRGRAAFPEQKCPFTSAILAKIAPAHVRDLARELVTCRKKKFACRDIFAKLCRMLHLKAKVHPYMGSTLFKSRIPVKCAKQ